MKDLLEFDDDVSQYDKVVGFAKFGKIFDFYADKDPKRMAVGDWECVKILSLMSRNEPKTKFLIICGSNFTKLSTEERDELFPNRNVFEADIKESRSGVTCLINSPDCMSCDEFLIIAGPISHYNGTYPILNPKSNEPYSAMVVMQRYIAPYLLLLNTAKKPWGCLVTDNRYFPRGYDMLNPPNFCIAQLTDTKPVYEAEYKAVDYSLDGPEYLSVVTDRGRWIKPEEYMRGTKITTHPLQAKPDKIIKYPVTPSRLETLWLYERTPLDLAELYDQKIDTPIVVANQVAGENLNKRYDLICEYFIDGKINCDLVGKWTTQEALDKMASILRFPDGVSGNILNEMLKFYKCGVIFKYDSKSLAPGYTWIVCKVWEYLHHGVLPILINYEKNSYLQGIPSWLYVNSVDELTYALDKIKSLDKNEFLSLIVSMLLPEYYNGSYLYNKIKELQRENF